MRCFNLASGLVAKSASVVFICRGLPSYLVEKLELASMTLYLIGSPDTEQDLYSNHASSRSWPAWSQEEDASATCSIISEIFPDWLVVDHYGLDAVWEEQVQLSVGKILVIDDQADRKHHCDALLDQNLFSDARKRYVGKVPDSAAMLLGPEYALIENSFSQARSRVGEKSSVANNILIFFGGADPNNCTEFVLDVLLNNSLRKFDITVVIGGQHPVLRDLRRRAATEDFKLHIQSGDIARLMSGADLCIGGGGVSTWERCCVGLPCLIIAIAANQEPIAKAVSDAGAARYLGRQVDLDAKTVSNEFLNLVDDSEALRQMSARAMSLVDGRGVERTVEILLR